MWGKKGRKHGIRVVNIDFFKKQGEERGAHNTASMEPSFGLPQKQKRQPLRTNPRPIQSEERPVVSQLARTPRLWKLFF